MVGRIRLGWLWVVCVIAAGCTLVDNTTRVVITATPEMPLNPTPAPSPTLDTRPTSTPVPALESSVSPYDTATTLLDGVCFEYLAFLDGTDWQWRSPADLSAFYDRVDASELCPGPVERQAADFDDQVLVGVVAAATGCDAAFHLLRTTDDTAAQTQTIELRLEVVPGCPYDLVEPLVLVVPAPPSGYSVRIAMSTP